MKFAREVHRAYLQRYRVSILLMIERMIKYLKYREPTRGA